MSRWQNKYVIGLTGNIAVGKSVVRQMLQHLGAYTIDADGLTHQAMSPGAPAYKPVIETFGQFILNPDKTINRAMLGNIVFSSPDALKKLEAIVHPVIGQAIDTLVSRAKQEVIVIEAIKLLEGDLSKSVDAVWVVDAKPQTQYSRLITKRKMTEEDAKQRILAQSSQVEKVKAAQVVIMNDGNVEETWKQVQTGWKNIDRSKITPAAPPQPPTPTPPTTTQATTTPATPSQVSTPPPAPAAPPEVAEEAATLSPEAEAEAAAVTVKRGMPSNAEVIAGFITKATGQEVSRMDVIMSFGQKSYLLAGLNEGQTDGAVGWQVENLITRVDELYIEAGAPVSAIVFALVKAVEEASRELQSEVCFVFLPGNTVEDTVQPFLKSGYELTTVKDIKIPAWREAVQEVITDDMKILTKKLRKDRVLKPI